MHLHITRASAEGDVDPTVLLMPAVPDQIQLAPWLPIQPQAGASPRSGGPRTRVRRAVARGHR
jgi:hypothetical protein